ncbi:right-handed parallel beta-helix repeat-containing protein [Streptomyces sp. NPDC057611]|uniref:right-handed parallel beta-helix repeat-containing protein n=1 Tax=Streptomyces sp. NPDC057611 TaxID=3346182 RepID=UPI0036B61189
MIEPTRDSIVRAEVSRRALLAIGAGTALSVAVGAGTAAAEPKIRTTYYVAVNGSDTAPGTSAEPLRTINAAAQKAQPGDTVRVRAGIYREEVVLPRGGTHPSARITYTVDKGADVTITGSDLFTTWTQVSGDVWQLRVANSYFNGFNPYAEQVHGDWFDGHRRLHRRGMVYLDGAWLPEATSLAAVGSNTAASWWSSVDGLVNGTAPTYKPSYDPHGYTTLTAKFPGVNPNRGKVEVGIRGTVVKPAATNCDYITIRGFTLRNAATNWAAPTMGQEGLVSAYWCKGWIITDNEIAYSRCCGIALGKYSDEHDGTRGTTEGYYLTIEDAQKTGGWSFANIGGHVVENNTIHHCGQTGIVGSLGAIGSVIADNEIYHCNTQGIWGGAEMAGIKLHAAIDVVISGNHIYNTGDNAAIWLDWMAQGTRVLGNLFHDNRRDFFCEVDHGPLFLANNVMLSRNVLWSSTDGAAWAHNLVAGAISANSDGRQTPYMQPHTTTTIANASIPLGAQQWMNNILGGPANLSPWDSASAEFPNSMKANVFTKGAKKSAQEQGGVDASTVEYFPALSKEKEGWYLTVPRAESWRSTQQLVSTSSLANAPRPNQPFTNPDGSAMSVSTDYLGLQRSTSTPFPGPFETAGGSTAIKVWSRVVPTTDAWGRPVATNPSGPGAATDAAGNITVHVRGTDNGIWQRTFNGTSWTDWTGLGGPNAGTFTGAPALTAVSGRTDVFVRGVDDQLWQRTWTAAGGWTGWTAHGGILVDSPAAATDAAGNITVHVRGTDNGIWQRTFNGTSWTDWTGLGGPNAGTFTGAPALTAVSGRTDVFVRGVDDQLWQRTWTAAGGWTGWTAHGSILVDSPAAATDANGNITVHVRGTDNGIWQRTFNGTSWTDWTGLGGPNAGTFTGAPALTAVSGRTNLFVRGTDNQLWQRTWTTADGWSSWTALGGTLK